MNVDEIVATMHAHYAIKRKKFCGIPGGNFK